MIVSVRLKGAQEITRALQRVQRKIDGSTTHVGRAIGDEGLRIIGKLTPRQRQRTPRTGSTSRGFPPLHKQWELIERSTADAAYTAVIRNRATATPAGVAVLAALEFGARPHTIRPRRARALAWDQSPRATFFKFRASTALDPVGIDVTDVFRRERRRGGAVVTKVVNHPGHRSFRMVEQTRIQLEGVARASLAVFAAEIEREFGRGFTIRVS